MADIDMVDMSAAYAVGLVAGYMSSGGEEDSEPSASKNTEGGMDPSGSMTVQENNSHLPVFTSGDLPPGPTKLSDSLDDPVGDSLPAATSSFPAEAMPAPAAAPAKPKKIIYAKEGVWDDIPDWGGRTDCPLLELPAEVLDMCFGLQDDLEVRDYVALAGVCKAFRHQLDEEFLEGIYETRCVEYVQPFILPGEPIYDYRIEPDVRAARAPFSRNVEAWRKDREKRILDDEPTYYIPPGARSTWTKKQYGRYREEKTQWEKELDEIGREETRKKDNQADAKLLLSTGSLLGTIFNGGCNRRILAEIKGRRDGEAAVDKDDFGIPIKVEPTPKIIKQNEIQISETKLWQQTAIKAKGDSDLIAAGSRLWANRSNTEVDDTRLAKRDRGVEDDGEGDQGKPHKQMKLKWIVPETDDESEMNYEYVVKYDRNGRVIPHDYWPSKSRGRAADHVNEWRISKTESLKTFKVNEAQLITLKHVLVHNPLGKQPKQLFVRAAVQALAFRVHGGFQGHADHMKYGEARARKLAMTRAENIEKAKAAGTYKPRKSRTNFPRHWYGGMHDGCGCGECRLDFDEW